MSDTTHSVGRPLLRAVITWIPVVGLLPLVVAGLVFLIIRAGHLLGYPYPLDYGEGPLLIQVGLLRSIPLWQLYGDPAASPYVVVNYPPVYHLLAALLAWPLGAEPDAVLLAGRLVSLVAAIGAVVALAVLAGVTGTSRARQVAGVLVALAFVGLPITREWATLMRVDMAGVCLGLWGLVLLKRGAADRRVLWAAIPLALSLFVKPSLIAAPAAGLVWLLFRNWRRGLELGVVLALLGGAVFGMLQWASDGWFAVHVLSANANVWELKLARGFWKDQWAIHWPLFVAGGISGLIGVGGGLFQRRSRMHTDHTWYLLPLYYTLFGAIVAFGIGKVGAYANYFLELYAGLVWLSAAAIMHPSCKGEWPESGRNAGPGRWPIFTHEFSMVLPILVAAALLRYYPLWSETYLKPYGMIEGANPARVAFGSYGIWQDLRREQTVLVALGAANAGLVADVRAVAAPIFTDTPGVAGQAGQLARLQAFEHRQILDTGHWDQRPLLRDLASGRVPLVVLDYLGNWLTPEMIKLITHRYAQDGSRGTYDRYRPVDPGPRQAVDLAFSGGLQLTGYHLASSNGHFQAGELLPLMLEWVQQPEEEPSICDLPPGCDVIVQVTDGTGYVLFETVRPLVYGALRPGDWGGQPIQHMQPFVLPLDLPEREYGLAVTVRAAERDITPPREFARFELIAGAGRIIGEGGYFVPVPFLEAWRRAGEYAGYGDPLMPAVSMPGFVMQCFERACLRMEAGVVQRIPLGELVSLVDIGLPVVPASGNELEFPDIGYGLSGDFLAAWRSAGGLENLGPPISPELRRGEQIIQYTRYGRLERPVEGGSVQLGRLGVEFLRLPGGVAYRWP